MGSSHKYSCRNEQLPSAPGRKFKSCFMPQNCCLWVEVGRQRQTQRTHKSTTIFVGTLPIGNALFRGRNTYTEAVMVSSSVFGRAWKVVARVESLRGKLIRKRSWRPTEGPRCIIPQCMTPPMLTHGRNVQAT